MITNQGDLLEAKVSQTSITTTAGHNTPYKRDDLLYHIGIGFFKVLLLDR